MRFRDSRIICLHSQLTVPIVVGYHTALNNAVSKKLVAQKYFGSVLMSCTNGVRVGTTIPSGKASISTGKKPPWSLRIPSQFSRLKCIPCSRSMNSASSMSSRVIGCIRNSRRKACKPTNIVTGIEPPRDST